MYAKPSLKSQIKMHQLIARVGVGGAARQLRLSDSTVTRIAAGIRVLEGSAVLAETRLGVSA